MKSGAADSYNLCYLIDVIKTEGDAAAFFAGKTVMPSMKTCKIEQGDLASSRLGKARMRIYELGVVHC